MTYRAEIFKEFRENLNNESYLSSKSEYHQSRSQDTLAIKISVVQYPLCIEMEAGQIDITLIGTIRIMLNQCRNRSKRMRKTLPDQRKRELSLKISHYISFLVSEERTVYLKGTKNSASLLNRTEKMMQLKKDPDKDQVFDFEDGFQLMAFRSHHGQQKAQSYRNVG